MGHPCVLFDDSAVSYNQLTLSHTCFCGHCAWHHYGVAHPGTSSVGGSAISGSPTVYPIPVRFQLLGTPTHS